MPDTGLPWEIPYLDGTEFVKDYPQASEDLADAVAAGLSAAFNPGIGSNVVQTVKDDTFSVTSATYTTVTGLTVTITPTTDTSKILVMASVAVASGSSGFGMARLGLFRGSTDLLDGDGSRGSGFSQDREAATGEDRFQGNRNFVFLDSPATTSAVTYEVRIRGSEAGFAVYVNRASGDTNGSQWMRGTSTITAIEVAA